MSQDWVPSTAFGQQCSQSLPTCPSHLHEEAKCVTWLRRTSCLGRDQCETYLQDTLYVRGRSHTHTFPKQSRTQLTDVSTPNSERWISGTFTWCHVPSPKKRPRRSLEARCSFCRFGTSEKEPTHTGDHSTPILPLFSGRIKSLPRSPSIARAPAPVHAGRNCQKLYNLQRQNLFVQVHPNVP